LRAKYLSKQLLKVYFVIIIKKDAMKQEFRRYFLIFLASAISFASKGQEHTSAAMAIQGEGPLMEQTWNLAAFHSMSLGITAKVLLRQGDTQKVVVRAQKNIFENIRQEVKEGVWQIQFEQKVKAHDSIFIWVTMPSFHNLTIGGSGAFISENAFTLKEEAELVLGGSGFFNLQGQAPSLKINVAGSGRAALTGFEADKVQVSIAGSGEVQVAPLQTLEASIAGSGRVLYSGNPVVRSSVAGSGTVKPIN